MMTTTLCIRLFSLVLLTKELVAVGPSEGRRLTLYKREKTTWNHANEICEKHSKKLLTMESKDVVNAVKKFNSEGAIWDGRLQDFWIGLHDNNDDPAVTEYVWTMTCKPLGSYSPWASTDKKHVKHCIRAKKDLSSGNIWETTDCSSPDGDVICEDKSGVKYCLSTCL